MSQAGTTKDTTLDSNLNARHLFATIASLTERGGRISKATSGMAIAGLNLARVGDIVTYEDGSEAVIIDGAGEYLVDDGKPCALVGSRLSNGDRIVQSLQSSWGLDVQDSKPVRGLFDPAYVPLQNEQRYRIAVRGSTTARGGVLREPSGTWDLSAALGQAGVVGDVVHYSDGSTAKIMSGLGLDSQPDYRPLAFVGSELDNGDTITDSREREGIASSAVFTVLKHPALQC